MAVQRTVGAMADASPSLVDLTGMEFRFAKRATGGVQLCGAGQQADGVISEGKAIGLHTSFYTGNQLKVLANAAINIGDLIASDAQGRAVVAVSGNFVVGEAKAAAAVGELVEYYHTNQGKMA